MTRQKAIELAAHAFTSGQFHAELAMRVALRSESQEPGGLNALRVYLEEGIIPAIAALGFASEIVDNSAAGFGPFLIAERHEATGLPTVLVYGHGDVVRGQETEWRDGLDPWVLTTEGDRWYGRGSADNKGQHSINLTAFAAVMHARGGRLGFNIKLLIETGEEVGSPGLRELASAQKQRLAADVLIASDGPRLSAEQPTVFLGSRGSTNFELSITLREGGHHSGNWGGLLANAGTILANAIASMVDRQGRILVAALRPPPIPQSLRQALADIEPGGGPNDPEIDKDWGEAGMTPAERVFAWNALEVLAFESGDPRSPVNAVPAAARAVMQLRSVVGTEHANVLSAVRRHLDAHGFSAVTVAPARMDQFIATRLDPADPWVGWTLASIEATTGKRPVLLPNLGGSLPNDIFADDLGLPTIWIPHSYPGCSQHAPNEHLLASIAKEGLRIMAGLFWDLGEASSRGAPGK
jgi:acetylornithine deacetylase/succinyl-diaminopimelate desuccinylase-like protein